MYFPFSSALCAYRLCGLRHGLLATSAQAPSEPPPTPTPAPLPPPERMGGTLHDDVTFETD